MAVLAVCSRCGLGGGRGGCAAPSRNPRHPPSDRL